MIQNKTGDRLPSPQGCYVIHTDLEGRYTYVNNKFLEIFGYLYKEQNYNCIGLSSESSIIPEDLPKVYDKIQELLSNPAKTVQVDIRKPLADGAIVSTYWDFSFIVDAQGVPQEIQCVGIDYTENFQALVSERNRLDSIIKSTQAGTWEWDVQTGETVYNERWAEIIGYTLDEIGPTSFETGKKFTHPDDRVKIDELLEAHFRGELDYYECESRMKHKNGEWVWVLDRGKVVSRTEDGKPQKMMGTHRDITRRKRKEQEILNITNAVDESSLVSMTDHKGIIVKVNQQFCEVSGYSEAELLGQNHRIINSGYHDKLFWRDLWKTITSGSVWKGEVKNRAKDGSEYWVSSVINPIFDDAGKITHYLSIRQDITARKKAELELEATKQKLDSIFNEMDDVVWSVSLPDYKMLFMTPSAVKLYGIPYEEFMADNTWWEKAIYEEDKPVIQKIYQQLQQQGQYEEEYRITSRDGKVKWIINKGKTILNGQRIPIRIDGYIRDITESKLAEQYLKASEINLKEAQSIAKLGRWELDLVINQLHWSDSVFEIFEIDMEKFGATYEGFLNAIHPDDRALVNEAYTSSLETGQPYEIEHRLLMANGRIKWLKESCRTDYDANGIALRSVGVVQDITAQKETELIIVESREQYQSLVQNIPGITYRCKYDADYTMLYMSSQVEELTGFPANDFINNAIRTYASIIHPDDLKWTGEEVSRCIDENLPWAFEYRILNRNGMMRWAFEKGLAIRNDKNEVIYLDGFILDVTDRKENEENLRKSNERFEKIAEATNDAVWDWDLENDSLFLGDAFKTLFGYNLEHNTTNLETWSKHIHPEDFERIMENLLHFIECGATTCNGEYRYKKADDTYTYVMHKGVVIRDSKGKAIRVVGAISDNPERKRYEEELVAINKELESHTKELQRSNEELEQFAFITSHDLQEPLRMITSFMGMLERKYADQLDEKALQYIHFATDGAKRMKQIILDLLLYSRVNRPSEQKERINLNEIVSEFLLLRRKLIAEKNADIIVGQLPEIENYIAPVTQLFHCLLDNALKYTREKVSPVIVIEVKEKREYWQFDIKDNGVGIDEMFFDKIFLIFQRLHNRGQYDGTGIGLSIAKRAVEFLGGDIWVESEVGVGTTFYFTISKTNN